MRGETWAIIVAGGGGARFGGEKQFANLCGQTVLEHAAAPFLAHGGIHGVVVVCNDIPRVQALFAAAPKPVAVAPGGDTRGQSVRNGLNACGDADFVLIHDAARPLVPPRIIDDALAALGTHDAVIPVCPVTDTVVRLNAATAAETLNRDDLARVQTPQGFRRQTLLQAYALAGDTPATDDAGLVMRANLAEVRAIPGDERNVKITYPWDLDIAKTLKTLGAPPPTPPQRGAPL